MMKCGLGANELHKANRGGRENSPMQEDKKEKSRKTLLGVNKALPNRGR